MTMKTPEEMKKGLAYCMNRDCAGVKCPYYNAVSCNTEKIRDALVYIQDLESRVPRWISVEERLPERGITKCSACVKCGDGLKRVVCASNNAELKLWTGWHGEKIENEITHWMPLPEPPKEE